MQRPSRHFRLVAFFVALAAAGSIAGVVALRTAGVGGHDAEITLAASVSGVCALGFAGVFFHRLRVLPQKWRETERYLLAIRSESAKYRALMEGAADMILVLDASSGAALECNARARDDLGGEGFDLFGVLVERTDGPRLRAALETAALHPGSATSLSDLRVRSRSGRTLVCEARLAAVELEDRRVVQLALRDRTHERAIEQELAVRERLSSVGLLTAGVAHEINNPLEGIGNHLKLLEREGLGPDERRRHVELIQHGLARIRDLVRELLHFARPDSARGDVDLTQVVDRARRLAAFTDRFREVRVETRGLDAPLRVVGDAGRLEQVVLNLLLNAATAMKGKGSIAIEARRAESAGRWIEISVADDGPGIAAEDLERLFDPFFTTTGGTGLGLSVCYGIAHAHGGTIQAANRADGGAIFTLRLPDGADVKARASGTDHEAAA